MRELDPDLAFAGVYDIIYREPRAFYAARSDFLRARFGPPPARLLDAGCGTGRQMQALLRCGYEVVGLDASSAMLARAGRVLAGRPGSLVQGDLRALPLGAAFDGLLCLESPLAYMLLDEDLAVALAGFRRALVPGGLLVADNLDYPATLGPDGVPPQTTQFTWSGIHVTVRESHSPDAAAGLWHMRQEFTVNFPCHMPHAPQHQTPHGRPPQQASQHETAHCCHPERVDDTPAVTSQRERRISPPGSPGKRVNDTPAVTSQREPRIPRREPPAAGAETAHSVVDHVLSMRPAGEYEAALEDAGFFVQDLLDHYPGFPPPIAGEQRMIFVARRR